ncbi:MAG: methylenetetrahydrofolate reductase [Deltaproteobacteria bacterium]|nr:methylenetetrahydrofolate reductase [Deltaproteobacteria bacterium]
MRMCDRWRASGRPTISLEVFPARTPQAASKLDETLDALVSLNPDFMSVTFGAGGSTRKGSLELATKLKDRGVEVLAYFACYGLGPDDLRSVLDDYRSVGVENVLAVRGDIPRDEPDFHPHAQSLAHASDLIAFIQSRYDFCIGAAGYPEGHKEAISKDKDIEYLKLKVDNGARFVIANYCYDNRHFFAFRERCRAAGIDAAILPGIMPIFSVKMMETLAGLCGATIPQEIRDGLASLPEGDKDAVVRFGIELARKQCAELLRSGVPGIHIYTMDRAASAVAILKGLREEGLLD